MSAKSNFTELYKSRNTCSSIRQSERRANLLKEQKQQRKKAADTHRGINELVQELNCHNASNGKQKRHSENPHKNQLQLSEWLMEKPDDIDNWYMVPCPKGKRCLLVAASGRTKVFNKYGYYVREFRSKLPGDHGQRQSTTVLDCIYIAECKKYYILDVLAYGNQDMIQCDVAFRFYWIQSKIVEEDLSTVDEHNEFSLGPLNTYDCADALQIELCLSNFPMWENNQPALDGLLFYHKESSYVHGTTPLVGWTLAFMVPEILHCPSLNTEYLCDRPIDYTDYISYIKKFDEDELLRKRKFKKRPFNKRNPHKMDIEVMDDPNSVDAIVMGEQQLEVAEDDMNECHLEE